MTDPAANLNSKYSWRELARKGLPKRSVSERVHDFLEIYGLLDEESAREQASRCIQCPNPGCVTGCPLCNPIPQWMQLTAEGRFLEAAAVLGSVTNMAEVCARVCPSERLCEHTCVLEGVGEPVAIRAIEQFLADYAFSHGQLDTSTAPPNGLKVAVVGSGPGALTCADELAKRGYAVTVFDSELLPGGLLVNGMPAFRVGQSIVEKRVNFLRKRGVVFRLGASLWREISLRDLQNQFDAVYLGIDARKSRTLDIPGADLSGVVMPVPFLLQKTTPVPLDLPPIATAERRVVVIGAGDAAMHCVRAAIRYGAREALCIYRRGEADMPCAPQEYEDAVEEGAKFMFNAVPMEILGNDGLVRALKLSRTRSEPVGGQSASSLSIVPGSEFEVEADVVIPAIGFHPVGCPETEGFGGLHKNEWGGIRVESGQMTNMPGVFAGGDIVRGPASVLDAVRDARRAADQIHASLAGRAKEIKPSTSS